MLYKEQNVCYCFIYGSLHPIANQSCICLVQPSLCSPCSTPPSHLCYNCWLNSDQWGFRGPGLSSHTTTSYFQRDHSSTNGVTSSKTLSIVSWWHPPLSVTFFSKNCPLGLFLCCLCLLPPSLSPLVSCYMGNVSRVRVLGSSASLVIAGKIISTSQVHISRLGQVWAGAAIPSSGDGGNVGVTGCTRHERDQMLSWSLRRGLYFRNSAYAPKRAEYS